MKKAYIRFPKIDKPEICITNENNFVVIPLSKKNAIELIVDLLCYVRTDILNK